MKSYRLLITTLSGEVAPEAAVKALFGQHGFSSLSLVTPAKSSTFFGQAVGFVFDLAPAGLIATSPTDFSSGRKPDDAEEWFRRRGIHTPEALLDATKPEEWNEILALRQHLQPKAVMLFGDATPEERAYGEALARESGLPLVTLAR